MHRQEITNTIEREMKVQHATARAIACRPTGQQSRCVEPKPRSIAPSLRTSISGATSEKANDVAFTFNLPSGRWSPSPFANHHHFRKKIEKGKKRMKEKKPGWESRDQSRARSSIVNHTSEVPVKDASRQQEVRSYNIFSEPVTCRLLVRSFDSSFASSLRTIVLCVQRHWTLERQRKNHPPVS